MAGVDLGFIEECSPYLLTNRYFPSKVGGKPAWLDLKGIPRPEDVRCSECLEPMTFLCQIYAPVEDEPNAFHRSIFLFICRSASCSVPNSAKNVKAFRSQLGKGNEFYSSIAPDEDEELPAIEPPSTLCSLCGCLGPLQCSQCKTAQYCSKAHQRIDWKNGHKQICKGESSTSTCPLKFEVLLPEYAVEIEADPLYKDASENDVDDDEADERRIEDFQELVRQGKAGNLSDVSETELAQYSASGVDDKIFRTFKKRVAVATDQIVRYQIAGEPLLIAEQPSGGFSIPDCDYCGSRRVFEFQVMPQLLNHLKDDTMDWGTIIVYTCSKSCELNGRYAKEYVVKQDVIERTLN